MCVTGLINGLYFLKTFYNTFVYIHFLKAMHTLAVQETNSKYLPCVCRGHACLICEPLISA